MKVIMKPIEMIEVFLPDGKPTPVRFKLQDAGEVVLVKADHIIDRATDRFAGNLMLIYKCASSIHDQVKKYVHKYVLGTCKWHLSKCEVKNEGSFRKHARVVFLIWNYLQQPDRIVYI